MSTQQQEPRMECVDCDYSLCEGEFDSGKGRIMFNDVNEDGTKYRCGCCDDRVSDPHGMFPNDEEEEWSKLVKICEKEWEGDEEAQELLKYYKSRVVEEEVGNCGSCDIELDHLRDGTTEDGHRCSDCYWTETQGYIPA